jgi:NAD(P)-dependent dehydrogenase (short-subunit alcohol dehydrogenase family)
MLQENSWGREVEQWRAKPEARLEGDEGWMTLASRASDFVTGAIIPVDGGYAIR